jgi:hypothetical protein
MAKKENPKTKNSVEKRKTIIVTDPKDKRLRAYNDSNDLYESTPKSTPNVSKYLQIKPRTENDYYSSSNFKKDKMGFAQKSGKQIPFSVNKPIGFVGFDDNSGVYPRYKKPVQPVVYQKPKPKPVVKTPVKTEAKLASKEITKPAPKPILKEEKKLYQGRNFMDSTGLRPNLYTKSEVANAARLIKEKKAKDKK